MKQIDSERVKEAETLETARHKTWMLLFNSLLALLFFGFVLFYFFQNAFWIPRGYGLLNQLNPYDYKARNQDLKTKLRKIEQDYNDAFYQRMDHINTYGWINKMLGRTVLDDAVPERSIAKGADGILYYTMSTRVETSGFVEAFTRLNAFLAGRDIPFVYVQAPNKHMVHSAHFPYGVMDYCNLVSQDFSDQLAKRAIHVLDLEDVFHEHRQNERDVFYVTDNHWNVHGTFLAYVSLVEYLQTLEMEKRLANVALTTDKNQYELRTWKAEYIGSQGKRVGLGFSDVRDDYEMLFPKFGSSYTFQKIGASGSVSLDRRGSFRDVFFFPADLEGDDIFQEKYNAFMGGGMPEEVIVNFGAGEDEGASTDAGLSGGTEQDGAGENSNEGAYKSANANANVPSEVPSLNVLIIKDSFAMPIAGFLSQNCRSITMLDIRNFANPRSIEEYVANGDFDLVLFIASPISMYYFPEMFLMPMH